MRSIDADKLLELIKEQKVKETGAYAKGLNAGLNIVKSIMNDEIQTPTAYDVDAVVGQLEKPEGARDMCTMEWKEVEPEQKDWEKQIDVVAYYGTITIGSIVYCDDEIGWQSVIDGHMDFLQAESLEDAKEEMIDVLHNHCTDQINYYKELMASLEELKK